MLCDWRTTLLPAAMCFLNIVAWGVQPVYGELVRPLARMYKGKSLTATTPEETHSWVEDGRSMCRIDLAKLGFT